jgi:hypothetical protein
LASIAESECQNSPYNAKRGVLDIRSDLVCWRELLAEPGTKYPPLSSRPKWRDLSHLDEAFRIYSYSISMGME